MEEEKHNLQAKVKSLGVTLNERKSQLGRLSGEIDALDTAVADVANEKYKVSVRSTNGSELVI